jgi:hypothetical protein
MPLTASLLPAFMVMILSVEAAPHHEQLPCKIGKLSLCTYTGAAVALQGLWMGSDAAELLPRRHFAPLVHYFPYFAEQLPGTMMLHLAFIATAGVLWPLQVSCTALMAPGTMFIGCWILRRLIL